MTAAGLALASLSYPDLSSRCSHALASFQSRKPSDGSGEREELSRGEYPRYPASFSPDGKSLAFVEIHPSRQRDIWVMVLAGDRHTRPLLATDADEWGARFSPHGRWIAYVSNETGREEVFIRPIDSAVGRKRLSSDGGIGSMWAP